MDTLHELKEALSEKANPKKAEFLPRFFKTGTGQYGEGDKFLGVVVPDIRKIARQFKNLPETDLTALLKSEYHEERLAALLLLVHNYVHGASDDKKKVYDFYLSHTKFINNWDLVDLSSHEIVGDYLLNQYRAGKPSPYSVLVELANSSNLWERRIAIVSTSAFIHEGISQPTLDVAEILLHDTHDLIHKAVGWMLREVGKRCSQEVEEDFLKKHYKTMPRTMLRYAIERFSPELRAKYLKSRI
ncbi:MAG: DNA alkylation repair protein [Patescibacteria group bacterium]|jgi:3-methyladenine DNA glycosylase AlkD